jgi:trehalose/maltose hydrolase-like predicted phosphorylase
VSAWTLAYDGFDPTAEGLREALCTLGNGYVATRGAAPEAAADDVHYPGTYVAGCYDRLTSQVAGRQVENEDVVNLPNWLPLTFRINQGRWFQPGAADLPEYRQELDLRHGVLHRRFRVRDPDGRLTTVRERRLVSMDDPHLAALQVTVIAENWAGHLEIRSALDGQVANTGVARYRALDGRHLRQVHTDVAGEETIWLQAETTSSRILVAEAARTRLRRGGQALPASCRSVVEDAVVAHHLGVDLSEGQQATVEKVVALYTSRDRGIAEPGLQARERVAVAAEFETLLERHALAWEQLWRRCRIGLDHDGEVAATLNLHVFHLLQTVSPHTVDLDAGVPARGLHGEAYRGHVFWDELFVLPFLNWHAPEGVRALLRYRYRRLPAARQAAAEAGYRGAMFPWQSGSDGREETQTLHLNPRSGRWLPDRSHRQRHVSLAIAYNVWHYYQVTGDTEFLCEHGAELLLEIARFWASIASYDQDDGRWSIRGVMGPDEYHDGYPDRAEGGLDNNAYTNVLAVWTLCRALEILDLLPADRRTELTERLALGEEEVKRWDELSRKLRVCFHGGIISQFEGYERLDELDWDGYRRRYGDIRRLDRILEAEGDSTNRYKASKQADVLMLFYLLSADELRELLARLGYQLAPEMIPRTIDYYLRRTSHGSTLSSVVHAWVLARSDRGESWRFFVDALGSDVHDVQGGTTAEGIHLGAMAGTADLVQRCYTGLEARGDVLWFNPCLPPELEGLHLQLRYRGHWGVQVHLIGDRLRVALPSGRAAPVRVGLRGAVVELEPGETRELPLP